MTQRNLAGEVTTLAELMLAHTEKMNALLKQADAEKAEAERIARDDLPELMLEAELQEFTLTNGLVVSVGEHVHANITEANRKKAHAWLVEHGFGGLIKSEVTVSFAASEEGTNRAAELTDKLTAEYGNSVGVKDAVHAGTLKAFIREQLEAGNDIPRELFGVFTFNKAEVKKPKRR